MSGIVDGDTRSFLAWTIGSGICSVEHRYARIVFVRNSRVCVYLSLNEKINGTTARWLSSSRSASVQCCTTEAQRKLLPHPTGSMSVKVQVILLHRTKYKGLFEKFHHDTRIVQTRERNFVVRCKDLEYHDMSDAYSPSPVSQRPSCEELYHFGKTLLSNHRPQPCIPAELLRIFAWLRPSTQSRNSHGANHLWIASRSPPSNRQLRRL